MTEDSRQRRWRAILAYHTLLPVRDVTLRLRASRLIAVAANRPAKVRTRGIVHKFCVDANIIVILGLVEGIDPAIGRVRLERGVFPEQ